MGGRRKTERAPVKRGLWSAEGCFEEQRARRSPALSTSGGFRHLCQNNFTIHFQPHHHHDHDHPGAEYIIRIIQEQSIYMIIHRHLDHPRAEYIIMIIPGQSIYMIGSPRSIEDLPGVPWRGPPPQDLDQFQNKRKKGSKI